MVGSGLLDGDENWVSDDELFEKMMNFFDIPMESLEGIGLDGGDCDGKFKRFQSVSPDPLQGDLALVSGTDIGSGSGNGVLDFLPTVPSDETSRPKQLLSFVEETSRAYIPVQNNSSHGSHSGLFQVPSPGSALESNSSCSVGKTMAVSSKIFIPVRTRSKRSRPSAFKQQRVMPPISPASSKSYRSIASGAFSQFVDLSESHFPNTISNPVKRKLGKKKKLSQLSSAHEMKENSTISELPIAKATMQTCFQRLVGPKKCTHCEITKTPQWREGPMGPKTLCNACGVRYRSGRLFPEYRPASSPTFVPSLHSNSHKKVIEMRNRASQEAAIAHFESCSVATGE